MYDPLRHGNGPHGDHDNSSGPFVQSRGLLGSIFGRSEKPQQQSPTSQLPTSRPVTTDTPSTREPMSTPRPRMFEAADAEPTREFKLPWVFRNFRLVMIAAFVIFGFGINVFDSMFDGAIRETSTRTFENAPKPSPLNRQGSYRLRVDSIDGNRVRMTDAAGETYTWRATDPAVRKVLVRHVGVEAMVFWRLEGGLTTIVGVVGPEGSVPPTAAPAADELTTTTPTADRSAAPLCLPVDGPAPDSRRV